MCPWSLVVCLYVCLFAFWVILNTGMCLILEFSESFLCSKSYSSDWAQSPGSCSFMLGHLAGKRFRSQKHLNLSGAIGRKWYQSFKSVK